MTHRLLVSLAALALAGCSAPGPEEQRGPVQPQSWQLHGEDLALLVPTCNGDPEVSTTETGTTVTVEVVSTSRNPGDACLDGVVVPLDAPLGERTVLDGRGVEVPRG